MPDRKEPVLPACPVAVVGVSALFPGSHDVSGFWRDILAGRDLLTDVPERHWRIDDYYDPDPSAPDKTYARRGAFLPDVAFDPVAFGIPPSTLPATDTAQLLALIVAKQVLDDAARGDFARLDRERISVILGVTSAQELMLHMASRMQRPVIERSLREEGLADAVVDAVCARVAQHYTPWQEATFPGLLGNVVAGRIANRFDLGGTNCVTDAACASSLSALSMAINELALGQSDLVICGGVDTMNDVSMFMCFSKTPALSPTGDCRPFSADADGTMLGEGLAMVALKRLADAERDGDRIYAVIRGLGSSSDGRALSVYAPRVEGQKRALTRAYDAAGYGAGTVELVEAHGTGTTAGDAAEFAALSAVFRAARSDRQWCALGTVKSQIGHTKATAGAAGLLKIVLALHHKVLPPTIKVAQPNPALDIANSPFYLNTQTRPWIRGGDHPRRASISSFGFGGSNFHATLEEYTGAADRGDRVRALPAELIVLSGADPAALIGRCRALAEQPAGTDLALIARQTQDGFDPDAPERLAVVAADIADFRARLNQAADRLAASSRQLPPGVHYGQGVRPGDIAFLFPGQGSQYVGMGADLAMTFEPARAEWDRAADARLHAVVFPIPAFSTEAREAQARQLTATEWAQPAIATASLAQLALLRALGVTPARLAGHSLGEITALAAAGALAVSDVARVTHQRGALVAAAAASTPGAMLAVGRAADELEGLLRDWRVPITIANANSPLQTVVAGTLAAIDEVEARLRDAGIAATRLPVATAFHSPIVSAACDPFAAFLAGVAFTPPESPVYGNADARPYPAEADDIRRRLAAQIASPVRFADTVDAMYDAGVRIFVEVGPSSVLTTLVEQCLQGREGVAVALDRRGQHGVTSLFHGLARLAAAGVPLRFDALWDRFAAPAAPAAAPAFSITINGTNYGKPAADATAGIPRHAQSAAPASSSGVTLLGAAAPLAPVAPAAALAPIAPAAPAASDAHAIYQHALYEAHLAFMANMTAAFQSHVGDRGDALSMAMASYVPAPIAAPPAIATPPIAAPPIAAPAQIAAPSVPAPAVMAPPPMMPPPPAPPAPAPVTASPADLGAVMLEVVADKTGYPVEMLRLDMALEADLGVDSIKRVEILAAMHQRVPGLADANPGEMAALRTLREIVEWLRAQAAPQPNAAAAPVQAATPGAAVDLAATMLAVVADKTGYPAAMLNLDMALEADLGIDSIKRVEILAAMQQLVPDLPAGNAGDMGSLRTLREIVAWLGRAETAGGPQVATAKPVPSSGSSIGRYIVREVDAPASARSMLPGSGVIAITDDGLGVAAALAAALRAAGARADVVTDIPDTATGVILLDALAPLVDDDGAIAVNRRAFDAARRLAARATRGGVLFVTVQDTGGDFGLTGGDALAAWTGGLPGLIKTAGHEWPDASVKAIDLERGDRNPAALAAAIVSELMAGGGEREVGLRADGRRTTLHTQAARFDASAPPVPPLPPLSAVVATGGARGVTAAALIELARRHRPSVLILGRTSLVDEPAACQGVEGDAALKQALLADAHARGVTIRPADLGAQVAHIIHAREVRDTLRAIDSAGARSRYVALDVRDSAAVAAAVSAARAEWGPIAGIIHGAGVLADKRLADKTLEQFDAVFDTKVQGLRALLAATGGDPLRFVCLFSSVAARSGNAGQADYAMANEVLNKVAAVEQRRRGDACIVTSINWGPWEGGMVTPALRAQFAARGVGLLPIADGARLCVDALTTRAASSEIVIGGMLEAPPSIVVNAKTHPYLSSHRIAHRPVVPAALALEWFLRAAAGHRPDLRVLACHDLRVWKGIALPNFDNGGDPFRITIDEQADAAGITLDMVLAGVDGTRHYGARVTMGGAASNTPVRPPVLGTLAPCGWTSADIYNGGMLFHGPAFHIVRAVDGISDRGIAGTLDGVTAKDWPGPPWHADVAALDGAIQLALLWGIRQLGRPSLPTRIGSFVPAQSGPARGPLHCAVAAVARDAHSLTADAVLTDAQGATFATLSELEMHLLPDGLS